MPIVERRIGKDGTPWGWESSTGEWVELDPVAAQGSTLGNLSRAAGRGFQDIAQGASELGYLQDNPIHPEMLTQEQQARSASGQLLEAQQQAATRTAPVAEAIGGSAPEVAAGVGAGLATGGVGLLPAIAGQAGAGALTGFLRPGDAQERAANAALGGVLGVLGEVALPVAQSAFRGMRAGLNMGEAITGRAAARAGNELDAGLTRAEQAAAQVPPAERQAREYWAQRAADLQREQGGSVGAAATPEGELGEQAIRENRALDIDEASGANTSNKWDTLYRGYAEENLGYKSPLGAGTRSGSMARMANAVDEYTMEGSIGKAYKANNQGQIVKAAGRALGIEDADSLQTLEIPDLGNVRGRLEFVYENKINPKMPTLNGKDIAKQIKAVLGKEGGTFEATDVEKWLERQHSAFEKIEVEPGEVMSKNLRRIRDMGLRAVEKGDQTGAEQLFELHARIMDLVEKTAEKQGNGELIETLKKANSQYRILTMMEAGASVGATRDINPKTLLNKMKAGRIKGGFGSAGPAKGTPEYDLWVLASLMAKDESNVPATGVRNMLVRKGAKVAGTIAGGAAGAGLAGAAGVFD